jgi:hypothetical protein
MNPNPAEPSADQQELETAARRRQSTIRHWRTVSSLLESREELQGVCAMADLIHEAVRWAA